MHKEEIEVRLLRLIELCKEMEKGSGDPFSIDIPSALKALRSYLPRWRELRELILDSEALNRLASVVRLQREWVERRASSLYIDPLLVELKLRLLPHDRLARAMLGSWRPVLSLENLTLGAMNRAIEYWNALKPLSERFREHPIAKQRLGHVSLDELVRLMVLSEEEFQDRTRSLLEELKAKGGSSDYWEFVRGSSFEASVLRAYLLSFLVSEGLVAIDLDPLEDRTTIALVGHKDKPIGSKSIAISLLQLGEQHG